MQGHQEIYKKKSWGKTKKNFLNTLQNVAKISLKQEKDKGHPSHWGSAIHAGMLPSEPQKVNGAACFDMVRHQRQMNVFAYKFCCA